MGIVDVTLLECSTYERDVVFRRVNEALSSCNWKVDVGSRILVKPNLLRAHGLTCTNSHIVAASCSWLLDHGAKVTVADSPGFGSAKGVAQSIGLTEILKPLGVPVQEMHSPVSIKLPDGHSWGVARIALESDGILSIPRIKAHSQMRLTLAVKNLFGCVCGLRKAVAHTVQGQSREVFSDCLAALWAVLPPVAALADGVVAMHKTGPSGGIAYPLACLGASSSAVALDTAIYHMLGMEKGDVPLWAALDRLKTPQVDIESISFSNKLPNHFSGDQFIVPNVLSDTSFRPTRLLWSLCRRAWSSWRL